MKFWLLAKPKSAPVAVTSGGGSEVRLELQDYLARTGMAPTDFARRINYARETIYQFLNGHYSRISSNDGLIRTAIRDFIAAHPIAIPAVSSGKLYETENSRLLRRYFYEALDQGRAYYLYGAPGTQKTYVLQHLIAELNRSEIAKDGLEGCLGLDFRRLGSARSNSRSLEKHHTCWPEIYAPALIRYPPPAISTLEVISKAGLRDRYTGQPCA